MEISKVTTAIKVGKSVRVYGNNKKNWEIIWENNNDYVINNTSGRVYLIVSNGEIKKIGGSQDKGGIKGTLNWYSNSALTGGPSVRTYGIHMFITEELDNGSDVEFYVITSEKVKLPVKGLFGEETIYTNVNFKSMENKCKEDYINVVGELPKWNIQERGESWPIYIREGCDSINNNSTKQSKKKINENTNKIRRGEIKSD
jgi:hypothetical protein